MVVVVERGGGGELLLWAELQHRDTEEIVSLQKPHHTNRYFVVMGIADHNNCRCIHMKNVYRGVNL